MTLDNLKSRWTTFAASKRGKVVLRILRVLFVGGIIAYLAYELTKIGWAEIWAALPTSPLFYLLFLLLYFLLPVTEVVLYRIIWTFDAWKSLPVFIKKRVYNKDVMGYSGEVYFYTWARKSIGLSDVEVLKDIRDQNIISSVASTVIAVVLVTFFLYGGQLTITDLVGEANVTYMMGGGIVITILTVIGIRLRKYLFSMVLKTALLIFALQCVRLVAGQALQIGQWAVAMPEVPLRIWFTYAAMSLIISRIPVIPNRDLLFLGAGVGLSGVVHISSAGVASMLVALTVLNKILNLTFFAGLSLMGRHTTEPAPPTEMLPLMRKTEEKQEPRNLGAYETEESGILDS
ncbi:MAG TPA: hypothetical protein VKP65_02650 [Rhodothermales bacterium]|nr:hypothetical protein [Rhodothermales bacterium]